MKKKLVLACGVVGALLLSLQPAAAHDPNSPRAEVHINYSYLYSDLVVTTEDANGWQAGLTYNFQKHVGVEFDAAGHYGRVSGFGFQKNTFMAGPRFSLRADRFNPWAHGLVGVTNTKLLVDSSTDFAFALGGGLDVNVNRRLAVRLGQLDWVHTRDVFNVDDTNDMRFSAGIVIKF